MGEADRKEIQGKFENRYFKGEKFSAEDNSFDEKERVLNMKEREDVIRQREHLSKFMKRFLVLQYVVIIVLLILQGWEYGKFDLESPIFYFLISGTFAQSCFLVQTIFKYVFSHKNKL